MSIKDIASCTGISEGSVQTILKKRLDLKRVCTRWVPHLLTEDQKTQRLKCARELLKTYKGCNSRVISNLLTGDETWVHMFEPQRRADNKQWKRKDQKRPCIAKRTISSKKILYAMFFNSRGPVVQVPCPSVHTVLFPGLKEMLSGNKYTSRSSLGSAIYQCLQQIRKEDYLSAFRDWVKRLQKCVSVKGEYFESL